MEPTVDGTDACWSNQRCEGSPDCPPRCPRYIDESGTSLLVRLFEPGDRASLVEMYLGLPPSCRTMGLPPRGEGAVDAWLGDLESIGWNLVALDGQKVVGHVGVGPAANPTPQLVVFVHQDYQGRRLGPELVKHAIAYAADDGFDGLQLSVAEGNQRAIRIYENIGFETLDYDWPTLGLDRDMCLSLTSPIAERVRLPPAERDRTD
jgi:RimJ/RimL family protein N-acetyltransferase